jgi:hypothetical protein
MNVAEWQNRLEINFLSNNTIGVELDQVLSQEIEHENFVNSDFHGYRALAHSFYEFYIQTFKIIKNSVNKFDISIRFPNYNAIVLIHLSTFKNLRASEILFQKGYPLDGFSLLRDLFERSLFLGAMMNKYTSFQKLFGAKAFSEKIDNDFVKYKRIKKLRQDAEKEVFHKMSQGIDEENLVELGILRKLLNDEIHSSRLTFAMECSDLLKGRFLESFGPNFNRKICALYMNRFTEVGWMILRTLPFLQPESNFFKDDWSKKWNILDESFCFMVDSLNKKIAIAVKELIEKKFPFDPQYSYFEVEERD